MPSLTPDQIAMYGLCIQTGAILVSAIGIIFTLLWAKKISCRRATLDIVLNEETDQAHIDRRTTFLKLVEAGNLAQWADTEKTASENSALLRSILNRYELVSIGIGEGTIYEKSYKKWCRTTLVKDWISCKPFVMQVRHNFKIPTYFCEFEKLAKKWATKEERKLT